MPSKHLSVRDWLNAQLHNGDLHLYVVMTNASAANPLQAYYQQDEPIAPLPIWDATPYADWQAVMPFLGELRPDSPFLDWLEQDSEQDWGWLASSPYPPHTVLEHLKGLTQVQMPDGRAVFFRFWDGRHLLPILNHMGAETGELLPVFTRYLINGQALEVALPALTPAKPYPWWQVPAALLDKLNEEDPTPRVDNLMQWLREDHAELYFAFPEPNLRLKTEHFVRHGQHTEDTLAGRFKAHMEQELTR
ncbi:DUF4123 domain-containing protein [Pseudomonas sp.]|uniref:DUF4123 domain-containing protein n=1 Tax=Pseudomonas sp. TaxID=306 RepID=UPI0027324E75|nr:DUF4123 domain-containing protein [Pseudomonas sp.]MDP3814824.1 DUF4123 domain-containing protein [Pseudomonas sp.]